MKITNEDRQLIAAALRHEALRYATEANAAGTLITMGARNAPKRSKITQLRATEARITQLAMGIEEQHIALIWEPRSKDDRR